MDSFDDLLETQLNELMLGSIARRVGSKIGLHAANKVLAKVGSNAAKGRVTFQDYVNKLFSDLREYLGEQGIRQPVIDDVLDFLKYRVGFDAPAETMLKLAYGAQAGMRTEDTAKIAAALDDLTHQMEYEDHVDPDLIKELLDFATKGGADEIQIRSGLHQIIRAHPSQKQQAAPLAKFIGGKKVSSSDLTNLFSRVARLLLKVGGQKKTDSKPTGDGVARFGVGDKVNDDLDEDGEESESAADNIASKKIIEDLDALGLPGNELIGYAQHFNDKPQDLVAKLNSKFSAKMCAKLSRVMLQLFVNPKKRTYLRPVIEAATKAGDPDFEKFIVKVCNLMKGKYKKSEVNTLIYNKVRSEEGGAGFLARLIFAFGAMHRSSV